MYLKLILRGLLRHRKSGERLSVLIALCSLAILFFLSFRDSFTAQYQQLAIDVSTAHLQVVPSDSPKLKESASCTDHRESLITLQYTEEMERFLRSIPAVKSVMLATETKGSLFTLEGEPTGAAPELIGVDPQSFAQTLPGVRVVEGQKDLAWSEGMTDIPIFRPALESAEIVKNNDRFVRENFRPQGSAWEAFKKTVPKDMPALFQGPGGDLGDEAFLASLNAALDRADIASALPSDANRKYDYRVDDARAALDAFASRSGGAAPDAKQLKVLRKRLIQSYYPDAITPVRDSINLNVPYTLAVPPARSTDPEMAMRVFPVKIAAYVQKMPLYAGRYYVSAQALRKTLGLEEREGTGIYIRLASSADTPAVRKALEGWLAAHGLDYVVKDYVEMGKGFTSTSVALRIITLILIVLFIVTAMIFIVNTVLLSVIKRRREIGTSIAVGLSPGQNILVMFGEMLALVVVSWAVGSLLGTILILALHQGGVPGIIFMPGGHLPLDFRPVHLAISFVVVLVTSGLATFIPLVRLAGVKPVDLLKEAA